MMSVQDHIDAVDIAKPIDPPATRTAPKPTSASVRANFVALKNAVQGVLDDISGLSGSSLSSLVLTGVSFATATAIVATDNALVALGKLQAQINSKQNSLGFPPENSANKNVAGGYAGLDSGGYLLVSQIPDAILHTLKFKGTFDGSTISSSDESLNGLTAIPVASSTNEGWFFISTGAHTTFDVGYITGDWVISISVSWQKIDNTDAISSFNGRTGAITLLSDDVVTALGFTPYSAANPAGYTANSADSTLLSRSNHTGTQPAATISDLAAVVTSLLSSNVPITESIVGRILAKVIQSDATYLYLQSAFWGKSIAWWQPQAGNTTSLVMTGGQMIAVGSGTSNAGSFDNSNRFGRIAKTTFFTSSTANAGVTGFYETVSPTNTGGTRTIGAVGGLGGFFSAFSFCLGGMMGGKFYIGMRKTTPPTNAEPDTFIDCILIGCKTGEPNLSIYYGGNTMQAPINLGANFPAVTANTDIYLVILHAKPNTGSVFYLIKRINTGDIATGELTAAAAGTQLPSNMTNLCYQGYRVNNPTLTGEANLHSLGFYAEAEF